MNILRRKNLPFVSEEFKSCQQCGAEFPLLTIRSRCTRCKKRFCKQCVEVTKKSFIPFRREKLCQRCYRIEFGTIMEESAAAERGSFDINEYEVVTPGDVLSPEEFKENPVEAQAVVDLAQNGLRQRPSSITMNELMSHEVALLPSNPLDKYRIEKSLGQGAFANVLLVEDTTTSDQFALKRIEVKDDAQKVKIVNEIFLMQQSYCPNVIQYKECYEYDGKIWICMECMDETLTELCTDLGGRIREDVMAYVLKSMLNGLVFLHDGYRLHRDIKSDNVLLSTGGEIKLGDFGFAAQLTESREFRNTFVGTACWMAPELVSGEQYSTPVDIWALGIVALELAEKEPPHITTPPIRTVYIIASQPAPTLKTPEKFSAEFRSFVSRCLVKSPDARATASELMSHPFIAKACTQAEFSDYIGQWKRGELDDDN